MRRFVSRFSSHCAGHAPDIAINPKKGKETKFLSYAGAEPEDLELLGTYLNRQLLGIKDACLTATQSQCLPRPSIFTACLINTPGSALSRIATGQLRTGKAGSHLPLPCLTIPRTGDANDKNANNGLVIFD